MWRLSERNRCLGVYSNTRAASYPFPATTNGTMGPDGNQPYYFTRRDGAPITVAGLWDEGLWDEWLTDKLARRSGHAQ
jgi:putative SOS response-associated peptidase YedK